MNSKRIFIIIGAALSVILVGALAVYAAWPTILLKTSSDKYVKYALKNTIEDFTVFEDNKKMSELYSKISKSSSTYDFGIKLNNIELSGFYGLEILTGAGLETTLVIDREQEQAGLDLKLKKSSTPIISAKGYVTNDDFGGIVPELYNKYIIAGTKDFAYNWNNSILGSGFEIDNRIDIENLYNIIFPKPSTVVKQTVNDKVSEIVLKYADMLTYEGKGSVITHYNGGQQKLPRIDVTLKSEDAKQAVEQIIDLLEIDGADAILGEADEYIDTSMVYNTVGQLNEYKENLKLNKDLVIELYFYKNKLVKVCTEVEITGAGTQEIALDMDMQIVNNAVETVSSFRAYTAGGGKDILSGSANVVYTPKGSENNISLSMEVSSPEVFDATLSMVCDYGFDEKNESVYANINKLELYANSGDNYISADLGMNISHQNGTGKGVVLPDDSVNITEAGNAEIFGIYTEVISNLEEVAKLVNLGGIL